MLRQLIINRINEIKTYESGFSKSLMRWKNVNLDATKNNQHISEFDFDKATDVELAALFELIIKRYNSQM